MAIWRDVDALYQFRAELLLLIGSAGVNDDLGGGFSTARSFSVGRLGVAVFNAISS